MLRQAQHDTLVSLVHPN